MRIDIAAICLCLSRLCGFLAPSRLPRETVEPETNTGSIRDDMPATPEARCSTMKKQQWQKKKREKKEEEEEEEEEEQQQQQQQQ